jgi:hypothetical protein
MAKIKKPAPKKGGPAKPAPTKKPMRRKSKRVSALPHYDPADVAPRRTVEEQFDRDAALMQALHDPENQPSQYGTVPMSYLDNQKPSLLRRAWNRVKRVFRYRSAETGLFVSKQHAEANPDTTVRERAD